MTFDMNEVHELELKRPNKTKEWRDKGHEILDEKYWSDWDNVVPIRLDDLYEGMELKACLDIIEELNNDCSFDIAKAVIEGQNHSCMSFGLVCGMVKAFCDRGEEFVNYIK